MRSERIILFLLAASQFTHIMDFMIIMPLGEVLMEELSIGSREFAFLVACYTITAGVSGLISAFVVDRFDRKTYFITAYAGFALGTVFCGYADTYPMLVFARIFTGFFGGVISSTVLAIVSDVISAERRAWGVGIVMSAFSAASALGLPVGLYFAFNFGWQWPFRVLGLVSMFNAAAVYYLLPPVRAHLDRSAPGTIGSLRFIMNIPNNQNQWMALVFSMVLLFGHFMVVPFVTPYLVMNVGFERTDITYVYLVGGLLTMFTNPRFGRWADRTNRYRVFSILAWLSLMPILILTNLPPVPVWAALVVTAAFFVLAGGRNVPSTAIVTMLIRPQNRGSFMSLNASVQNMCAGLGSLAAGWLVTIPDGGQHVEGYWHAGLISALFTLFAIGMMRRMRKVAAQTDGLEMESELSRTPA